MSSLGSGALLGVSASATGRFWRLRAGDDAAIAAIARQLDGDELMARLLAVRHVSADEVADFLNPTLRTFFPDPSRFADMDRAAACVLDALQAGQRVTVFADYDVDGGTSAAQLIRYFRAWNRTLDLYVPDRLEEGYGPSPEAFSKLKSSGCELVITVDCGAAAYRALEEAQAIGLPVVVLDHHLMQGVPPPAAALVNPNREDCTSGCGHMAAAGVVFVFIVAMNRLARERGVAPEAGLPDPRLWLDLCALGTICDMAPLTGVNRALVTAGLKVLAQGANPGLRALCDVAGIARADSVYHAGFVLGPRLNSGGRIGQSWLAARLLASDDRTEALALAEALHGLNAARKAMEADILHAAGAQAEAQLRAKPDAPILVLDGEGWHPGVIGIVAGRLKEAHHRPVIVLGHGPEFGALAKGSGRSVAGINLGALIGQAAREGVIASGGGHAMAAGLSLEPNRIDAFRDWLEAHAAVDPAALEEARVIGIDALMAPGAATPALYERIARTGPFGIGASEPRFAVASVACDRARAIGEGGHLRFIARNETGQVSCMAGRAGGTPLEAVLRSGTLVHLVGHLKRDDWKGREGVRFDVEDAAPASE